jgi:GntR family transcriptional regulator, transcriptional repressor for pyruvate dehydrogenase complex
MANERLAIPQRRRLSDQLVESLVAAIVDGVYPPGSTMPSEGELASMAKVSRLTVREAVKSLQGRGVLRVEQGRGTFVNSPSSWTVLDPILMAAYSTKDAERTALTKKLIEARRLVEVGVAELAATRRDEADLVTMGAAIKRMEAAQSTGEVDAFVEADIDFHDAILNAAGNAFVAALFEPIRHLVYESRRHTSSFEEARGHAIKAHKRIFRAIRSGAEGSARNSMRHHLEETEADLEEYGYVPIGRERTHTLLR